MSLELWGDGEETFNNCLRVDKRNFLISFLPTVFLKLLKRLDCSQLSFTIKRIFQLYVFSVQCSRVPNKIATGLFNDKDHNRFLRSLDLCIICRSPMMMGDRRSIYTACLVLPMGSELVAGQDPSWERTIAAPCHQRKAVSGRALLRKFTIKLPDGEVVSAHHVRWD